MGGGETIQDAGEERQAIQQTKDQRDKRVICSQFVEISLHNQLNPRQGSLRENNSWWAKQQVRRQDSSYPLYFMQTTYSREGVALTLLILIRTKPNQSVG